MGVNNIFLADESKSYRTLSLPEIFEEDLYMENDDTESFSDFLKSSPSSSCCSSFIKWINIDIRRKLMLKMESAMERERVFKAANENSKEVLVSNN